MKGLIIFSSVFLATMIAHATPQMFYGYGYSENEAQAALIASPDRSLNSF
jgi:hypothetical protein